MSLKKKLAIASFIFGLIFSIIKIYITPSFQPFLPKSLQSSVLMDLLNREKSSNTNITYHVYTPETINNTNITLEHPPEVRVDSNPRNYYFPDGSNFYGTLDANGKFIRGKLTREDYIFDGSFKGSNEFDNGILKSLKGNRYTYSGSFKYNQPHGQGIIIYSDGSIFEGEFFNGNPVPKGLISNMTKTPAKVDNRITLEEEAQRSPIRFSISP